VETAKSRGYLFTNKQLFKLILPLVMEQMLTLLVGMADTIMVSSVGEAAVSGVSLVDTVNILLINVFIALATGGAVVAGQYIGSKKYDQACKSADQLFVFMGVISIGVMVIMYLIHGIILDKVFGSITADVRSAAFTYLMIVTASIPFIAIYNAGAALFRAMGNSSISMKVSIVMNAINVCGNAILIYGLHRGVEGVAIPTVVSRVAAAVIMTVLLLNQKYTVHLTRPFKYKFNGDMIKKMLYIGVPNSLENSMFQLGKILVLSLVSSFGTVSIAANAVGNNIASIECMPGLAMSYALTAVVSQCVGANDYEQVKYYIRKLIIICYVLMFVLNAGIMPFLNEITNIYSLSSETAALAKQILILHGINCCIVWSLSFNIPNALRACADVKYTLIVSAASMWLIRIGASFVLGKFMGMGLFGVWVAMILDWYVRAVFYVFRLRGGKWQKKALVN
jgi:putative MATE family efflux protein